MSSISVSNPSLIKDVLHSYLVYTVESPDIPIPLIRGLKEFTTLRQKLRSNWPGMIIPALPDLSNEQEDVSTYINLFINGIININELKQTEEVDVFLSTTPDLIQALNSIQNETFEDIADKYEKLYSELYNNVDFDIKTSKTQIRKYIEQFEKIYSSIKNYNNVLISANKNFNIEHVDNFNFLKLYTFHESETISKYANSIDKLLILTQCKNNLTSIASQSKNPYESYLNNSFQEEQNILSLIEALQSLENIYDKYEQIRNHLTIIENRMKEMVNSKNNWLSYLTLKSPEQEFNELTNDKLLAEVELTNMKTILKYAYGKLCKEIKDLKEKGMKMYYEMIGGVAEKSLGNVKLMEDYWEKVEEKFKGICGDNKKK